MSLFLHFLNWIHGCLHSFQQGGHPTLVGNLLRAATIGIAFWLLEKLWTGDVPKAEWPSLKRDLVYWIFTGYLMTKWALSLVFAVAAVTSLWFLPTNRTWLSAQPFWLQIMEMLLLSDFLAYWAHRSMHRIPFLWRIHAMHHSSESLTWLAATRVHPLETIWMRICSILPIFLLGFSPKVFAIYIPWYGLHQVFIHCSPKWNSGKLAYLITLPDFHHWHHTSEEHAIDKNFSFLFPVFDFLFGTAYLPRDSRPAKYGLLNENIEETFAAQLCYPFQGWAANTTPVFHPEPDSHRAS